MFFLINIKLKEAYNKFNNIKINISKGNIKKTFVVF